MGDLSKALPRELAGARFCSVGFIASASSVALSASDYALALQVTEKPVEGSLVGVVVFPTAEIRDEVFADFAGRVFARVGVKTLPILHASPAQLELPAKSRLRAKSKTQGPHHPIDRRPSPGDPLIRSLSFFTKKTAAINSSATASKYTVDAAMMPELNP